MEISPGDNPWAAPIIFLPQIDSTNSELIRRARQGAGEGTTVVADTQFKGKGRKGRGWYSPSGQGLWMSVLLRPGFDIPFPGGLSLMAGLAACRAVKEAYAITPGIKWPNDLVVKGKKVGGILVECGEGDVGRFAVVGIGINISVERFPTDLETTAGSLLIGKTNSASRRRLMVSLLFHLRELYQGLPATGSPEAFMAEYREASISLGRSVTVHSPLGQWEGKALEIKPTGELIVEKTDGSRVELCSGEVSIRETVMEAGKKMRIGGVGCC